MNPFSAFQLTVLFPFAYTSLWRRCIKSWLSGSGCWQQTHFDISVVSDVSAAGHTVYRKTNCRPCSSVCSGQTRSQLLKNYRITEWEWTKLNEVNIQYKCVFPIMKRHERTRLPSPPPSLLFTEHWLNRSGSQLQGLSNCQSSWSNS